MKCGVITFHRAINYGGVLQAYALQKAIEKTGTGVEAEVIDYRCPSIEKMYRPTFKDFLTPKNIKRIAAVFLKNGTLTFNNEGFAKFREKYLKTSEKAYFFEQDLKDSDYDIYITGSDQVWSYYCAGFDKAYFLNFVDDGRKKNSYAASFGVGQIPSELSDEYYDLLNDYNHISVREEDGAKIIKSVINRDVEVVPDPTMLLDKEDWSKLLPQKRRVDGKYILVYMISEDDRLIEKALELSEKTGLKVYYINDRLYKKRSVVNLRRVSPEQWVDLFMNAEYVFTNSFHGVAFGINFRKNLYVCALNNNTKVNSRIVNIIDRYNLQMNTMNVLAQKEEIDIVFNREKEKGYLCLKEILGE